MSIHCCISCSMIDVSNWSVEQTTAVTGSEYSLDIIIVKFSVKPVLGMVRCRDNHLCALLHDPLPGRVFLAGHELIQPELQDLRPRDCRSMCGSNDELGCSQQQQPNNRGKARLKLQASDENACILRIVLQAVHLQHQQVAAEQSRGCRTTHPGKVPLEVVCRVARQAGHH